MASKLAIATFVLCILGACFAASPCSFAQFEQWKAKHNKVYATNEEQAIRYKNFCDNMAKAALLNKMNPSASFGATRFADMSAEEFQRTYLLPKTDSAKLARSCLANGVTMMKPRVSAIPENFDWNKEGKVSDVKDQGSCGSCWAFSTVGLVESVVAIKTNSAPQEYSEQMLVDCSHGCTNVSGYIVCNEGCNGGWHWAALQDIIDWGGIALRKDYPYTGHDGKCRLDTNPPALYAPIKNYTCLSGPELADEKYMASYLVQNGPLSIALDASPLQLYFGGIIDPMIPSLTCSQTELNHAVLITGYGVEKGITGSTDYWVVKNSWGTSWGEKGYFRIRRGTNLCGLASAVLSAEL